MGRKCSCGERFIVRTLPVGLINQCMKCVKKEYALFCYVLLNWFHRGRVLTKQENEGREALNKKINEKSR